MSLTVTFVGTGDAFGSGGRMNTCILVDAPGLRFAVDFGATSVNALKAQGISHDSIDAVLLTHFHGDHAGGVPVLLMDSMLGTKRSRPLTLAGPPGVRERLQVIFDAMFPGSHVLQPRFPLEFIEIPIQTPTEILGLEITTWPAVHTPETVPTSMRIQVAGKSIAYTGDTAWNDHLPALARGTDLLISECYFHSKPVPFHMNYPTIQEHRAELETRRLILTHMGPEMLVVADSLPEECAYDGMVVEV